MALQSSFKPTADGKGVNFMGFDQNGVAKTYKLQVKTADMAQNMVDTLLKEVEEVSKLQVADGGVDA